MLGSASPRLGCAGFADVFAGALEWWIAQVAFEKVGCKVVGWNERFLPTELVQGVCSGVKCVHSKRLPARVVEGNDGMRKGKRGKI